MEIGEIPAGCGGVLQQGCCGDGGATRYCTCHVLVPDISGDDVAGDRVYSAAREVHTALAAEPQLFLVFQVRVAPLYRERS